MPKAQKAVDYIKEKIEGITPAQENNWDALVDRFFDQAQFRFNPSAGTSAGFHQFDTKLEDFSQGSIQQRIGTLRERAVQGLAERVREHGRNQFRYARLIGWLGTD